MRMQEAQLKRELHTYRRVHIEQRHQEENHM